MANRQKFSRNLNVNRALLMAMPFALAGVASQQAQAVDHNVTDMASLRTAVDAVNATATNDRILLAAGTYQLASTTNENANADGDFDITKAGGTLEITGADTATTILDGNNIDRLFHFTTNISVTLSDLTIQNGLAVDDAATPTSAVGDANGGGVANVGGGDLTLNDVVIESCVAQGANGIPGRPGTDGGDANGGGIYSLGGALTMQDGAVINCTATGGSGGFGTAMFPGPGGQGGDGGASNGGGVAMVAGASVFQLLSCIVNGNSATGGRGGQGGLGSGLGGGIGWYGGDGGTGGAAAGGGIHINAGQIAIQATTIGNNTATGGQGGLGGTGVSPGMGEGGPGGVGGIGADAAGGGCYIIGGTASLDSSTVSGNQSVGGDGGTGGQGGNAFSSGTSGGDGGPAGDAGSASGGGVFLNSGSLSLTHATISSNVCQGGDGQRGGHGGTEGSFGANTAGSGGNGSDGGDGDGGGFSVAVGTSVLSNSTLAANVATAGNPGVGGNAGLPMGAGNPGFPGSPGVAGSATGGGIIVGGGTVTLDSALVGDNTAANDADVSGAVNADFSLVEDVTGATITGGNNVTGMDPALGPLQDNGGSTETHAITTGSPALNVGRNTLALLEDQRGAPYARDDGNGVDIGAYEDQTVQPSNAPVVTSPATATNLDAATFDIQGTADADTLVRVYDDVNDNGMIDMGVDNEIANEQLTGGGTSYSITVNLTQDADNNFLVTAEGTFNLESSPTDVPTITEDSTPPTDPVVSSPASAITVGADDFAITGTAEADSLVRIYTDNDNDGSIAGETVVDTQQLTGGSTAFSITVNLTQDADNNFLVTNEDTAANESNPADVPTITEDSTPPAAPVVTDPSIAQNVDISIYAIIGTAEADSLVRIYNDANDNGTVDMSEAMVASQQLTGGDTAFSITTPLSNGDNNFLATAEDAVGNESSGTDVPLINTTADTSGGGGGGDDDESCSTGTNKTWWLLAALSALAAPLYRRRRV